MALTDENAVERMVAVKAVPRRRAAGQPRRLLSSAAPASRSRAVAQAANGLVCNWLYRFGFHLVELWSGGNGLVLENSLVWFGL